MAEIDDKVAEIIRDYEAHILTFESQIAGARRILANPHQLRQLAELRIQQAADVFDWEVEEDKHTAFKSRLWAGATVYTATGEGMTQSYLVTWAISDADFRRKFVRHVGRYLAHSAWVGDALEAGRRYEHLLSFEMRDMIRSIVDGTEASPGFSYFVKLHRNMS